MTAPKLTLLLKSKISAIIALFLGILFYQDILFASYSFIPNSSSKNAKFHCYLSYFGINLTFTPMHFSIVSIKNCNHKSYILEQVYIGS